MKRIELRLPKDNILFSYPTGTRSAIAATLLNVGQKLSDIATQLSNIEERILEIDKRMLDIEGKTLNAEYTPPIRREPVNTQASNKEKIARSLIEGFGLFE